MILHGSDDDENEILLTRLADAIVESGHSILVFHRIWGHEIPQKLRVLLEQRQHSAVFVYHPVKDLASGAVAITSQNHGFAVRADSLPADYKMTQVNLNDDTVEGIEHRELPVYAIQYHPEAAPGPHDARPLFDRFIADMAKAH